MNRSVMRVSWKFGHQTFLTRTNSISVYRDCKAPRAMCQTMPGERNDVNAWVGCLFTDRFNRLAWGHVDGNRPQGVIAAGLENGELALWDPASILAGGGYVLT